jgi:hypothetical protein
MNHMSIPMQITPLAKEMTMFRQFSTVKSRMTDRGCPTNNTDLALFPRALSIDMLSSEQLLFTLASVAILHESVLKRFEVDHLALPIIAISGIAYGIAIYATNLSDATAFATIFWTSLWLYIGAYRAFFHPLQDYPGPFAARLSKLWVVTQVLSTEQHLHWKYQQLQKEYGDYVRTGPRELSIFDPAAVQPILGFQSKTTKGPHYDILEKSLNLTRDKSWHRQRRKVWDIAMKASLSGYAPRVEEFTDQLLARFKAEQGKPVSLLEFMSHYSYDVSSDLAFGDPLGFTKGEESETAKWVLTVFEQAIDALGLMYHLPWLLKALGTINSIAGPVKVWTDWSIAKMDARIAVCMHLISSYYFQLTKLTARGCSSRSYEPSHS